MRVLKIAVEAARDEARQALSDLSYILNSISTDEKVMFGNDRLIYVLAKGYAGDYGLGHEDEVGDTIQNNVTLLFANTIKNICVGKGFSVDKVKLEKLKNQLSSLKLLFRLAEGDTGLVAYKFPSKTIKDGKTTPDFQNIIDAVKIENVDDLVNTVNSIGVNEDGNINEATEKFLSEYGNIEVMTQKKYDRRVLEARQSKARRDVADAHSEGLDFFYALKDEAEKKGKFYLGDEEICKKIILANGTIAQNRFWDSKLKEKAALLNSDFAAYINEINEIEERFDTMWTKLLRK